MRKIWSAFSIAVLTVAAFLMFPEAAQAQATRTWVSGVGDDANPCSRTAPCKTFAGAISKTAAAGEIDVLDPGGFGAVTITKAITIDGGGSLAGVLVSGTNGIVVSAGANDVVTLRNMVIDGIGTGLSGVKLLSAGSVHLEQLQIWGFTTAGVDVSLASPSTSPQVYVTNVTSRNNGASNVGGGMWVRPNGVVARVTVTGSQFSDNTQGIRADNNSILTLTNCQITGNDNAGVLANSAGSTSTVVIDRSLIALNFNGLMTSGSSPAVIYISNDVISTNVNRSLDTSLGGTGVISYVNNVIVGNGLNSPPSNTTPLQ